MQSCMNASMRFQCFTDLQKAPRQDLKGFAGTGSQQGRVVSACKSPREQTATASGGTVSEMLVPTTLHCLMLLLATTEALL